MFRMKSVMIGVIELENAVRSVRLSLHCLELPASPCFSFANSVHSGNHQKNTPVKF